MARVHYTTVGIVLYIVFALAPMTMWLFIEAYRDAGVHALLLAIFMSIMCLLGWIVALLALLFSRMLSIRDWWMTNDPRRLSDFNAFIMFSAVMIAVLYSVFVVIFWWMYHAAPGWEIAPGDVYLSRYRNLCNSAATALLVTGLIHISFGYARLAAWISQQNARVPPANPSRQVFVGYPGLTIPK